MHPALRPLRRGLLLIVLLANVSAGGTAMAQHSEVDVKAAFILNFARYAEWPGEALPEGAPMRFCLLGDEAPGSALYGALAQLQGKVIRGHTLEVRAGTRFDPLKPCHLTVVYRSAAERKRVLFEERHTLTVAEGEEFIEQGGALGLVVADHRVQFEANLEATRRAGIHLPAQLLKLSRRVKGS